MDNKERVYKLLEEIQEKLAEGWQVNVLSRHILTSDKDTKVLAVELVLEKA